MLQGSHTTRMRRSAAGVLVGAAAGLLGACSGSSGLLPFGSAGETLEPADFIDEGSDRAPLAEAVANDPGPAARRADRIESRRERDRVADARPARPPVTIVSPSDDPAGDPTAPLSVRPGGPGAGSANARPTSPPELIEAKVGDVNGRPVFANEFLEPVASRLEANARRQSDAEWREEAAGIIAEQLRSLIQDELLRAEAASRLEPEEKFGLRVFLEQQRQNLISQNQGSRTAAERRLIAESGETIDDFLRREEREALIILTLRDEIISRASVSWRDIERRYRRDVERWNPPPSATFRAVRVRTEDYGESVQGRLANTADPIAELEAIAADDAINGFQQDVDGQLQIALDGPLSEAEIFGLDNLNAAATALSPGEIAGPIPQGPFSWFVALEQVQQTSTSLYEAQRQIEAELRSERREEAIESYVDNLIRRASITDIRSMIESLIRVATNAHGPGAVAERDARGG